METARLIVGPVAAGDPNAEPGATFSFEVTPATFEAFKRLFERPTAQERDATLATTAANHG